MSFLFMSSIDSHVGDTSCPIGYPNGQAWNIHAYKNHFMGWAAIFKNNTIYKYILMYMINRYRKYKYI